MKRIFALTLIALACKFSTGQKLVGTYYDWNKIHPKEQYYVNSAGQKNGLYKEYNQNGVVTGEYNYVNGVENGLHTDYAATQNNQRVVAAKGTFKNGELDGHLIEFCNEDGYKSKVQEGNYTTGKKTGLWKEWWCTEIFDKVYFNILKSIGSYKNGLYNGNWSFYLVNGNIEKRGAYVDGKENGVWKFYDPMDSTKVVNSGEYVNGNKIGLWQVYLKEDGKETDDMQLYAFYKRVDFSNAEDTLLTVYYLTGEKKGEYGCLHVREYGGGFRTEKEGNFTEYFKSGKIATVGSYKLGVKTGDWKRYYESGALYSEETYNSEGKSGIWNTYYESGKIQLVNDYRHGPYGAPSKEYDESGKVIKVIGGGND